MYRQRLKNSKRLVVKVGTSSLTYESGRANLDRIDRISRAISDLMNQGYEVILVTSGAIGIGMGKLRLSEKPESIREKQAIASVGQSELMSLYSRFFSSYSYWVGQILLTKDDIEDELTRTNAINTFESLIEKEIVPIVNENDTVSTMEIFHNGTFGDNDILSAEVAKVTKADLLILLSDIDGFYDCDPNKNKDAKLIDTVDKITDQVRACAGGSFTARGTGGMLSKLQAAELAMDSGIDMVIAHSRNPGIIKNILAGEKIGTMFASSKKS